MKVSISNRSILLKYFQCLDRNRTAVHEGNAHLNIHCFFNYFTWSPAETNFDNIFEAFRSLFKVVTFNAWLGTIHNAEDSQVVRLPPYFL